MVLGGRERDSDRSIQARLADWHQALCFFHTSFAAIYQRVGRGDREALLKETWRIGRELMPLVQDYHANAFAAFDPLPLVTMAPHTSRAVVRASQLLQLLGALDSTLGGAVLCMHNAETSVVTTQLDESATRWICCRVSHALDGRESFETTAQICTSLVVVVSTEQLEQWRRDARVHRARALPPDDAPHRRASLPPASEPLPAPPAGKAYAGLLLVCVGNVSVAVMMELDALDDPTKVQAVRALCDARMGRLDAEMHALLGPPAAPAVVAQVSGAPQGGTATPSTPATAAAALSMSMSETASDDDGPATPVTPVSRPSSVQRPLSNSAGSLQGTSDRHALVRQSSRMGSSSPGNLSLHSSPLVVSTNNAVIAPHFVYGHDSFTGSSFCAEGVTHPDLLLESARLHEHFWATGSTAHQVMLRGLDRGIVAKKLGTREVFFLQQPLPATASAFDVETDAKRVLESEFHHAML